MIYVTTGTHHQPFDRLVHAADALAAGIDEPFIAQIGNSAFAPRHMTCHAFMEHNESFRLIREARCIISHAGIGTIINAKKFGTPIILVPRLRIFKEHNNDHQLQIIQQLQAERRPGIIAVDSPDDLNEALKSILARQDIKQPGDFSGRERIRATLNDFLKRISMDGVAEA